MRRRLIALALLAAVAGGAGWYWLQRDAGGDPGELRLYGNVDIRQVDLGFRVSGRIERMCCEEGDVIEAGQVLAVLDKVPFQDEVRIAEAELAARRANLTKMETGTRPSEIAQARALVVEREASLRNAVLVLERQARLVAQGHVSEQAYDDAEAEKIEAELISRVRGPTASRAAATSSSVSSAFERSACTASADRPIARISRTVASAASPDDP